MPYHSAIDVTASPQKIYAATPYSLFSVTRASKEISRLSKVSGLSETGISTIRFDEIANKLFIAYSNSNVDVMDSRRIHTIPDLKRSNLPGDKSIYHFYPSNERCYLSTGIGVLVLDALKYEIADTWMMGNGGGRVKTNMFTKDALFFYAATDEGLKRCAVAATNPADFQNWQTLSGKNGLPPGPSKAVVNLQNKIIAFSHDSLFVQNGNNWELFFGNGFPIGSINATDDKVAVCQSHILGGISRVIFLNGDGSVYNTIQQAAPVSYPQKGMIVDGEAWVADLYGGLSEWSGNNYEVYKPNSPEGIATGELTSHNGVVYAAAGSVNDAWVYQYNRNGIYRFANGEWNNYNQFKYPLLDTLMDFITVAIDPRDETFWGGSFGGGLLHVKGSDQFQIYKQNSPLLPTVGDPTSYRVSGLSFDRNHNLWVVNYGAERILHVLKDNGNWQSFTPPFALNQNAAAQLLVDDADQEWIVAPKGNGLLVFNHGASLENTSDDRWRRFRSGAGNGNLPPGEVLSIAKDKSGFIWVGTTDGVGVIQCADEVFTSGCEAVLPIVKGGNFANYLFKGEEVRSIAVDGADRKWIATKNGAWLISADGDVVMAHFTESNSPLLSNEVQHIAINALTGEVFFGTAKGLCSFRGTATEGDETTNNLFVFPNPVPPNFNGRIGMKGLKQNSFVKITELNGRLVFQTKATGGQATWNGKDYLGRPVASGVYLVLVTDEGQQERTAGKIVFIGR